MFALGAASYLVVILYFHNGGNSYDPIYPILWTVCIWNVALLGVTVLVIIDSVKKVRRGATAQLTTDVFTVKLASIVFFVLNFAMMALIGFMGFLLFIMGGVVLTAVAIFSIGLTYSAMLSTSVYGWASVVRLRREGVITANRGILYAVLLTVFVADILVGIILFATYRRHTKAIAAAHTAALEGVGAPAS